MLRTNFKIILFTSLIFIITACETTTPEPSPTPTDTRSFQVYVDGKLFEQNIDVVAGY